MEASEKAKGGFERFDDIIFMVEKTLVTTAAMVMTVTVSLDILHRFTISEESRVAKILLGLMPGGGESESLMTWMTEWGAPVVSLIVTALLGAGLMAAFRAGQERECSRRDLWIGGLLAVVVSFAASWVMAEVASKTVCITLAAVATLGGLIRTVRQGNHRQTVLVLALGGLGIWGATMVRQDYIWSQELSLILLSWMAFLGGSMATRLHKHISVDALSKLVPKALAPWFRVAGLWATVGFCVYISALTYEHIFGEFGDFHSGETRPSTGMPSWTITLPVLISFVLMTLRFGAAAMDAMRNPSEPAPGGGH